MKRGNLRFIQKVELIHSLDVVKHKVIVCLRNLNSLRNTCVHEEGATISRSDVEKLTRPISDILKDQAKKTQTQLKQGKNLMLFTYAFVYSTLALHAYFD